MSIDLELYIDDGIGGKQWIATIHRRYLREAADALSAAQERGEAAGKSVPCPATHACFYPYCLCVKEATNNQTVAAHVAAAPVVGEREAFETYCKRQGFTEEEIRGPLHELQGCWRAAWQAAPVPAAGMKVACIRQDLLDMDFDGDDPRADQYDEIWLAAQDAHDKAVPHHQRGFSEWQARVQAAIRVLVAAAPAAGMKVEHAAEICSDQNGKILWVSRYVFNRIHKIGDTFIQNWKEYEVLKAELTVGKNGGALVEHVVRLIADRTPAAPAAPVDECEQIASLATTPIVDDDNREQVRTNLRAAFTKLRTALTSEAEDAARYRWIRSETANDFRASVQAWEILNGDDLDAAIDAARKP